VFALPAASAALESCEDAFREGVTGRGVAAEDGVHLLADVAEAGRRVSASTSASVFCATASRGALFGHQVVYSEGRFLFLPAPEHGHKKEHSGEHGKDEERDDDDDADVGVDLAENGVGDGGEDVFDFAANVVGLEHAEAVFQQRRGHGGLWVVVPFFIVRPVGIAWNTSRHSEYEELALDRFCLDLHGWASSATVLAASGLAGLGAASAVGARAAGASLATLRAFDHFVEESLERAHGLTFTWEENIP
jgi:hypothetical protein